MTLVKGNDPTILICCHTCSYFVVIFSQQAIISFFRCTVSIRDILSWVNFINVTTQFIESEMETNCNDCQSLEPIQSYFHGACLVFLDALGAGMFTLKETSFMVNYYGNIT